MALAPLLIVLHFGAFDMFRRTRRGPARLLHTTPTAARFNMGAEPGPGMLVVELVTRVEVVHHAVLLQMGFLLNKSVIL